MSIARAHCVSELAGKSKVDQARADMLVECMDDVTRPFLHPGYVMNQDADAKVRCS